MSTEGQGTPTTWVVNNQGLTRRAIRACEIAVVEGVDRGKTARIDRAIFRVGSHALNELSLQDPTVSKHHLSISVQPAGYHIADLDSSNGTFLDNARLGEVTVQDEVVLRLGDTRLRVTPLSDTVELAGASEGSFGTLIGRSPIMRELFGQLAQVAKVDSGVLIEGETGTGKELAAESLHAASDRGDGPFVVIDCGALQGALFESELFGHKRGAFSGADDDRPGLVLSANGGTLFLDEIGELPLPLQAKLVGVLERKRVTPVGSNEGIPVDFRLIAATHRDLARDVNRKAFRADLFYRIAVVRLLMPSLRERVEDIPILVQKFLDLHRSRNPATPAALSSVALSQLLSQPWVGNVRELRNAVERAVEESVGLAPAADGVPVFTDARDEFTAAFERNYLERALALHEGNVSNAARAAGVDRRNFQRMLRRHGFAGRTPGTRSTD